MALMTPLQRLLRDKTSRTSEVAQAVGVTRYTVRRWRLGDSYPLPSHAERLIAFYGRDRLDFNGCYEAVEIEHG